MFPLHNPAQQLFNWHCRSNNISESNLSTATVGKRAMNKFISSILICMLLLALPSQGFTRDGGNRAHSGSRTYSQKSYSYTPSAHRIPASPKRYTNNPKSYSRGGVKRTDNGKIARNMSARNNFLKDRGLSKVPKGYQVDHKKPLYAGGADKPSNMQLLTITEHRAKTKSDYRRYGR
jgi:5-methylcytosine-specific restriction endonuclease McrA